MAFGEPLVKSRRERRDDLMRNMYSNRSSDSPEVSPSSISGCLEIGVIVTLILKLHHRIVGDGW